MSQVKSITGYIIRLPHERWLHISTGHPEVADLYYDILQTVAEPHTVYDGGKDEQIAVRLISEIGKY